MGSTVWIQVQAPSADSLLVHFVEAGERGDGVLDEDDFAVVCYLQGK